MLFIALPILILFLVLTIKKIDWAFFALLASLPLYVIRFNILGIPSTLLEGMILILFIVWFFKNLKSIISSIKYKTNSKFKIQNSKLIPRYPFDIEITLVIITAFIAMGLSYFSNSAMGIYKAYFFEAILVYLLLYNIPFRSAILDKQVNYFLFFKKIITPLSIAAFYISVFAIYQKFTGHFIPNELWAAAETRRVTSFFGYPNAIALFLAPVIMLQLGFLLSLKSKYKELSCTRTKCEDWTLFKWTWFKEMHRSDKVLFIFIKTTALLSILSIYFARSEGALIAIFLSSLISLLFLKPLSQKSKLRRAIIALGLISLTIIITLAPLRSIFIDRLKLNDFSGQIRKAQWSETAIMLRDDNWLLGAGLNNYQNKIAPYHKDGIYLHSNNSNHDELIERDPEYQKKYWQPLEIFMYPHNIFLNFWVELGLFGLFIFIFLIFKFLYLVLRFLEQEKDKSIRFLLLSLLSTMLVVVIHGIVDVPYFKNDLSILFWLVFALLGGYTLKNKIDLQKN